MWPSTEEAGGEPPRVDSELAYCHPERSKGIIIGHLIPAGSGVYRYAEIDIQPPAGMADEDL